MNIIVLKSHREPSTLAFLLHIFPVRVLHLTPSLSFSLTCCFSLLALNRRIVHSRERTICRVTWGFRQSMSYIPIFFRKSIINSLSSSLLLFLFLSPARSLSSRKNNLTGRRRRSDHIDNWGTIWRSALWFMYLKERNSPFPPCLLFLFFFSRIQLSILCADIYPRSSFSY